MSLLRIVLGSLPVLAAAAEPAAWVPVRWPWADTGSLDLLRETPVNCLLVKSWNTAFVQAASARGVAVLASLKPGDDIAAEARRAASGKLAGIVLEGEFPEGVAARAAEAAPGVVVQLPPRARMKLGQPAPVMGSNQGVWPGVQISTGGAVKAAPTGSPWIDTNAGFLRAVRAWGYLRVWLGNLPPGGRVLTGESYLHAIADAELAGGRWVVAFDDDLAARLHAREPRALADWKRMAQLLAFYEAHRDWGSWSPFAQLAVVQDPDSGALLSGGILDMMGARHTPVRPLPASRLTASALAGATMAVNVDGSALPPEKQEVLKGFARSGGTLLTPAPGPPPKPAGEATITLDKAEQDRIGDLWHDVQILVGRRNLGVRLFNVAGMLSNLLVSPDGKQVVLHLVNYTSYPVENITVQMLGQFRHARLYTPEGAETALELYPVEGGVGVDIPRVSVCASLRLD